MPCQIAEALRADTLGVPGRNDPDHSAATIFAGPAPLGDREFLLTCLRQDGGYLVRVDGVGEFAINETGTRIEAATTPGVTPGDLELVTLGPVLTLALACQGVLCFHASSNASDRRAAVFLGGTGSGKSTLAGFLAESQGGKVKRLTDDITPAEPGSDSPVVLPHFPQLKLPAVAQWGADEPSRVPWHAAFFLEEAAQVRTDPIAPHQAAGMLLRQVVALALFAPDLRQRVVEACAALASSVPTFAVAYPRRFDALRQVKRTVTRACGW